MSRRDAALFDAAVISADADLCEMLCILLEETGYSVNITDAGARPASRLLIVDLDGDGVKTEGIPQGEYRCIIGITSSDQYFPTEGLWAVIRRPFGFTDFKKTVRDAFENSGRQTILQTPANKAIHIEIDENERSVTSGGSRVQLTPNEYKILAYLVSRRGNVVMRDELTSLLGKSISGSNQTDVHICTLRRKLEDTLGFNLITTVRNKGYLLK